MTMSTPISLTSSAELPGVPFATIRAAMLTLAEAGVMRVLEDSSTWLHLRTALGQITFALAGTGVAVKIEAARPDELQTLRARLVDRLTDAVPEAASALRWSGAEAAGALPANFRKITVRGVDPLGTAFLRVRISADDFALFDEESIHFRLLLAPAGTGTPTWPWIAENGATRWPSGDQALHKPVYTARHIDPAAGEITFDVFVHEGGRVTEWARAVTPGDTLGLIGPGGGGIPRATRIHMFGDETAFPAIARILDTLPATAEGRVTLQCDDGAACGYPMPEHPGITVTWLRRDCGINLADLALAEEDGWGDRFLWFAGEKADAQRLRAAFKAAGGDSDDSYIAAYWTRPRAA
ncbi:MAG: siderophore-interacting protein [Rhodobacteraceae bacterium]|nr:siderophore-interacting protein [Paracoccaceae bacterium]